METRGGSRPGSGRKKGALGKKTRELVTILDNAGYCPIADLIENAAIAKKEYARLAEIYDAISESRLDANIKVPLTDMAPQYLKVIHDSATGILPFLYPKRKAIEFNDPNGTAANTLTEIFKRIADMK